jgi:hypothetical protein
VKIGHYWNSTFGLDVHYVNTTVEVIVTYQNGVAAFGHIWHLDEGGAPIPWYYEGWLLTGKLGMNWAVDGYNCTGELCEPDPDNVFECEHQVDYWYWDYESCECTQGASPIVVDLVGDGFAFTDPGSGVQFDLLGNGHNVQTAWTSGGRDAFLALDRSGNGLIDGGKELFGNVTAQLAAQEGQMRNGFLALSVFDTLGAGGDGDGEITAADSIFGSLRLWFDTNHDGVSQPTELRTLASAGIAAIELDFKKSKTFDEFGNRLLFRSKVELNNIDVASGSKKRNAVDVWFNFVR